MGKMMMMMMSEDVHVHVHHHHPSSSSSSIDSNTDSSAADDDHAYGDQYDYYSLSSAPYSATSPSSLSSTNINNNNNNDHHHSYTKDHLSTDLRLGLTLSQHFPSSSSPRGQYSDWPPIKGHLKNTLAGKSQSNSRAKENSLFVKVYMEGIPIGRKLDLLSLDGYHTLISTLSQMFKTNILYPDIVHHNSSEKYHILTYEDKDGDWMMVGDVPWEMFLSNVKRLKIATMDTCQ